MEGYEGRGVPLPAKITLNAFQVMPAKTDEEYRALKESIRHDGRITYPLVLDAQHAIIDGHHRYIAWQELIEEGEEIERPLAIIRVDLFTDREKRALARQLNASQRSLSRPQRKRIARQQLLDTPHWSNRRIEETSGLHSKTVRTLRESMEASGEIDYLEFLQNTNGKWKPRSALRNTRGRLQEMSRYVENVRYQPNGSNGADEDEAIDYASRSKGALVNPSAQSEEAKRQRRLKNAFRKTTYALSQLIEATSEDAVEVAQTADEGEAKMLVAVYGHAAEWLELFVLNLNERKEAFVDAEIEG